MRGRYDDIRNRGAEVVAVGTGDAMYARAFVADERIPFPVLLDEDGTAAEAASLRRGSVAGLMRPQVVAGGLRAAARGHRQHRSGKRPMQLGATFVIGPGGEVRYEHLDRDVSDHAPLDRVTAAL